MLPRILEFEDGRVKITAEAYGIPELHAIIMKHADNAEPYLAYAAGFSYPDGAYIRIPKEDQKEAILYDVKAVYGDFDEEDDLIPAAIESLRAKWESKESKAADEMEEEVDRWLKYLRETPLGGEEMKNRLSVVDKMEKTMQSAINLRKLADERTGIKLKGANEMGEY